METVLTGIYPIKCEIELARSSKKYISGLPEKEIKKNKLGNIRTA
jgi:hypothetical protein